MSSEFIDKHIEKVQRAYDEVAKHEKAYGYQKAADKSLEWTQELSLLGLKSLILIHAGALVSIPAFIGAIKLNITSTLIYSGASFTIGLMLAFISVLLGYLSLGKAKAGLESLSGKKLSETYSLIFDEVGSKEFNERKEEQEEFQKISDSNFKAATLLELVSISLILLSLLLFSVGIYFLAEAIEIDSIPALAEISEPKDIKN